MSTVNTSVAVRFLLPRHRPCQTPSAVQVFVFAAALLFASAFAAAQPNILFISVDDMSCDSVGAFGCQLSGTTPNIDRLAGEGMKFEYAHVQVGNCMPSRNVMFSGRYPHNSGVQGFYQVRNPSYPVLCELMQGGGYFTAIRGKTSHSTPYSPFPWDLVLDEINGQRTHIKDADSYHEAAARGMAAAKESGKPFCLLVNVSDPHKPFYGMDGSQTIRSDPHVPTRIFTPEEVPVPEFLFDHLDVRLELAHYYSSVRRADDCVGATLKALNASGQADNTVVIFLSDHGMPLPFAKTYLYHHSTRTPWIVRWPGVVAEGTHDQTHMISAVDLLPTLLDIAGIKHPPGLDGRSFLPLLQGQSQTGRHWVFKEYNENAGGHQNPIRGVQTRKFGYLFSPWVNGRRTFRTATQGTLTYRALRRLSQENAEIAARLKLFEYGETEQFFDYENDPDALHNLIDDPEYQDEISRHRKALEAWMRRTGDHALTAFLNRNNPDAMEAYVAAMERASAERRSRKPGRQRRMKLISLLPPDKVSQEQAVILISHRIPQKLKTQKLHVTIKDGQQKRMARQIVDISGNGTVRVTFELSKQDTGGKVFLAAFVGPDFSSNLQHVTAGPIAVSLP